VSRPAAYHSVAAAAASRRRRTTWTPTTVPTAATTTAATPVRIHPIGRPPEPSASGAATGVEVRVGRAEVGLELGVAELWSAVVDGVGVVGGAATVWVRVVAWLCGGVVCAGGGGGGGGGGASGSQLGIGWIGVAENEPVIDSSVL